MQQGEAMSLIVMAAFLVGMVALPQPLETVEEGASVLQADRIVGYWGDGIVTIRVWREEDSYLGRIERCIHGDQFAEKMYSWRIGVTAFEVLNKGTRDGALLYQGLAREWNAQDGRFELRADFELMLHSGREGPELAVDRGGDTIYFTPDTEGGR